MDSSVPTDANGEIMYAVYQSTGSGGNEPRTSPSAHLALELRILDADYASHQPAPQPGVPSASDSTGPLVLVVSGDADVRNYVQEHLRTRPEWRTVEADSVAHAIELLKTQRPTVLVLDAPEATLLTHQGHARNGQLPVVLLADAFPAHFEARQPTQVLLPWPFEVNDLVNTVARLVGQYQ
jgi:CheY-like chemotaxis protein